MEQWAKLIFLICLFGFLKEFQPTYQYLLQYLNAEWTGNEENRPYMLIDRYSYIVQLVIIFLIMDVHRQKPLLVIHGLCGIVVMALWLYGNGYSIFTYIQILYGTFMATEIAYHTYMYARSPPELYKEVTAYTRAALLAGKSLSTSFGLYLINDVGVHLTDLGYTAFIVISVATVISLFLPSIKSSTHLLRIQNDAETRTAMNLPKLWKLFLESYKNSYVRKWSIYWIMATAGFIQVETTFSEFANLKLGYFNNATDITCFALPGFVACIVAAKCQINFKRIQDIFLILCSLVAGGLFFGLFFRDPSKMYICIVLYAGLYYYMTVFASTEIAENIPVNSYGLIFGINTFVAIVIQTFLMFLCAAGVLAPVQNIEKQYFLYGLYHFGVSIVYIIMITVSYIKRRKNVNNIQSVQ